MHRLSLRRLAALLATAVLVTVGAATPVHAAQVLPEFNYHSYYSLKSSNITGHFIRHRYGLAEISTIGPYSSLDRNDATWKLVPGLTGVPGTVSFESRNYRGSYLRHQGWRVKLNPPDGSQLFREDATFWAVRGLDRAGASWASFESLNYPGHFVRHANFRVWVGAYDGSELFRKDATYYLHAPLAF